MKKAIIFMFDKMEETEFVTTVDLLRRAGVQVSCISLTDSPEVVGSNKIHLKADVLFDEMADDLKDMDFDALIMTGGPGTDFYLSHNGFLSLLGKAVKAEKLIAAICAAPTVLGRLNYLNGKRATCYGGMENLLIGADSGEDNVVVDGNFITSRGVGTAVEFGLAVIEKMFDGESRDKIAAGIMLK